VSQNSEFDPASVAIKPAATVMLLRETSELGVEVFMMRRTTKAAFAGGMYVFPGGAVDAEDSSYEIAAIRECFEEAGVLLARTSTGTTVRFDDPVSHERFTGYRHVVHAGERSMTSVLTAENLVAQSDELLWVAHWVTPYGEVRRFDTRFFVVAMPDDQIPLHDDKETVGSLWVTPKDALHRARAGELLMLPPTTANLEFLAAHSSVDEIMAAARTIGTPPKLLPKVKWRDDGRIDALLMPGDAGYDYLPDR
jgi:8-oxo-dGTP pyrophosphatase MutT (NUDIX family)